MTTPASFAFFVDVARNARLSRSIARRGSVLAVIGLSGLIFGTFWIVWGIVLVLLGDNKFMGAVCSVVASGPAIAGAMALSAGVRRRDDAESARLLGLLADARGEVSMEEVSHLTGRPRAELNGLGRTLARRGAISLTRPAAEVVPAVVSTLGGPALHDFRAARIRRAKWLVVFAVALMGFASFWSVVAIAGLMKKDFAPALVLVGIAAFPWIGGAVLLLRAREQRRRAHRVARLVVLVAVRRATTLESLAQQMDVTIDVARDSALRAVEIGVVPTDLVRRLAERTNEPPERAAPAAPLESWIGRTLARVWRIESHLARGGMGAVFRGRNVETNEPCAIKVLLPGVGFDDDALRRFEREVTAASKLGHPGIARILDFGRTDEGAAYLVMELLEGETLEARLQRLGALPWRDALSIVREVGQALARAHDAGLLHRDIKPANIFLRRAAPNERAVLLDFGLVKPIDETLVSRVTGSGVTTGTPLYMSPEQAAGDPLDVRSDVYSLAVVLYEAITGTPPFFDRALAQVYARLLREDAPRIEHVAPGACPAAIDAVLARALARSPSDRFAGVPAFLNALDEAARASSEAIAI